MCTEKVIMSKKHITHGIATFLKLENGRQIDHMRTHKGSACMLNECVHSLCFHQVKNDGHLVKGTLMFKPVSAACMHEHGQDPMASQIPLNSSLNATFHVTTVPEQSFHFPTFPHQFARFQYYETAATFLQSC